MNRKIKFFTIFFVCFFIIFFKNKIYANSKVSYCDSNYGFSYGFSVFKITLEGNNVFCIDHGKRCATNDEYYEYGSSEDTSFDDITERKVHYLSNVIDGNYGTSKIFENGNFSVEAEHVVKQYLIWEIMDGSFDDYDDEKITKIRNLAKDIDKRSSEDPLYGQIGDVEYDEDYVVMEELEGKDYITDNDRLMVKKIFEITNSSILHAFSFLGDFIKDTYKPIYYYKAEKEGNQRLITTVDLGIPRTVIPKARYFFNDDSDPVYIITGDEISVNETKDFRYDDKDSYVSQGDYDKLMSAYYSGAEEKEANSSNNYTVDFYFKSYLIKVHHYLNVLDSNENPTWSECKDEPDYIYLLVDDKKSDTLVGDYYDFKKYIENAESGSGDLEKLTVSFEGSYYFVKLNKHKSSSEVLEINIDYEPRSLILNSSKLL